MVFIAIKSLLCRWKLRLGSPLHVALYLSILFATGTASSFLDVSSLGAIDEHEAGRGRGRI